MTATGRRRLRLIAVALTVVAAIGASLAWAAFETSLFMSDLADEPLGTPAEGEALRGRFEAAHGGLDRWRARAWVELRWSGRVHSTLARGTFGVEAEAVDLTLRFDPRDRTPMTLRLVSGDQTVEGPVAEQPPGLRMLAASIRHLFELPFAMTTADVVHSMPPVDGAPRVFMSWGEAAPQMETDQYILWLDGDDRVDRFQATVRAVAPFVVADAALEGWIEREGLRLPAAAKVANEPGGPPIHEWTLDEMTLGPAR